MILVAGSSTNFGLKAEVEERWKRLQEIEKHGDFNTTYSSGFKSVTEFLRALESHGYWQGYQGPEGIFPLELVYYGQSILWQSLVGLCC